MLLSIYDAKIFDNLEKRSLYSPITAKATALPIALYVVFTRSLEPVIELLSLFNKTVISTATDEKKEHLLKKRKIRVFLCLFAIPLYIIKAVVYATRLFFSICINPQMAAKKYHPDFQFLQRALIREAKKNLGGLNPDEITFIQQHLHRLNLRQLGCDYTKDANPNMSAKRYLSSLEPTNQIDKDFTIEKMYAKLIAFANWKNSSYLRAPLDEIIIQEMEKYIHIFPNDRLDQLYTCCENISQLIKNVNEYVPEDTSKANIILLNNVKILIISYIKGLYKEEFGLSLHICRELNSNIKLILEKITALQNQQGNIKPDAIFSALNNALFLSLKNDSSFADSLSKEIETLQKTDSDSIKTDSQKE